MAFAIMRAKKLNSMGTVAAALQHCYRDRETPNADQERTPDNEHMAATSTDQAMGRLRELLPEKRRKDAVLAVEYVMTASPEWWTKADQEQQADFFDQAHKWLADKYGADRIITATIHRDETSPHLSAFVVPLTQDGRLSAKEFIGNRSKMTADQTSFAKAVEHLGLERGIERSRATHTSIKQHYAAIERAAVGHVTISPEAVKPQVIKKGIFTRQEETPEAVAERLTAAVTKAYEPMTAKAAESAQNARRNRELQETMVSQRERLKTLQRPFEGLTKEQMTEVLQFAAAKQRENAKEKERRQAQRQLNRQQHRGRDGGGLSR
ncbi:plasmid recombination protein [Salmonella enterica subsp. enterica serovar Anatum]|nr:plasmid recombination enzyme [Salmonella enterica subsp. enterica serovar Anatum]EFB0547978.1 plasmid recombination enzyme [Salmonella enterica subsp. enterica serovar Infantis]EFB0681331.1 plasmid recombination enzyme [Salmonella enterica subsp. enterica serovar Kentucky]EJU8724962.1 plasmid recombination protein [Salmonella enterica subsp. enterica]EJV8528932.1 plasmid recombination protein [Salmonella enterica]